MVRYARFNIGGLRKKPNKPSEWAALTTTIKKDKRREERRLKRVVKRQDAQVCFHCRQTGHTMADCKSTDKTGVIEECASMCYKCGSTEHNITKCRLRLPPGAYPYAKCFVCKELGHFASQCVDNPRGLYPNGGCCGLCGSVEHFKRNCPEHQKGKGIPDIHLRRMNVLSSPDELVEEGNEVQRKKGPKIIKF